MECENSEGGDDPGSPTLLACGELSLPIKGGKLSSSNFNPEPLYVRRRVRPTMEINARVISGLDPGAIPGGSTKFPSGLSPGTCGADQHRQTSKGVAFSRPDPPFRVLN